MIIGVSSFGQVNNTDYSYVTTNFFHINYLPLIPTSSWLITAHGDMQLPGLHWPCVLHGYSKVLLAALVMGATFFALFGLVDVGGLQGMIESKVLLVGGFLAIVAFGIVSFYGLNVYLNECFVGAHPIEAQFLAAIVEPEEDSWDDVP